MYKYIFGPVPSRRLGVSLGIDLVTHKICSLDCIYCECGATTSLTMKREEYVPISDVLKEIDDYFSKNIKPDFVTFSGSGEPTLNIGIGRVIEYLQSNYDVPVCVLTNGTLLKYKNVRDDLLKADIVMPSMDSVLEKSFKIINRPEKTIKIEEYIEGIKSFKDEFSGSLDLEIFIIPGINDSKEDIASLKKAIFKINPDSVLLNSLDRPGTINKISGASLTELTNIKRDLGFDRTKIISKGKNRKNIASYRSDKEKAILGTIFRRPCTIKDISEILGLHINDIGKYLDVLIKERKLEVEELERGIFYKVKK